MKSVESLDVYNLGMDIAIDIYKMTEFFPKSEIFGLTSQMRRAAISITSNLSEGAARNTSGEYKHFVGISRGSAAELRSQVNISCKLGFIDSKIHKNITEKLNQTCRMLTGLINSLSHTPAPTQE